MIFFVDTENVGKHWLETLKEGSNVDQYVLFYSEVSKNYKLPMDFETLSLISMRTHCIRCFSGSKNALDFQLVAELGRRSVLQPNESFVILSNDTGYDYAVRHLREAGVNVIRKPCPQKELDPGVIDHQTQTVSSMSNGYDPKAHLRLTLDLLKSCGCPKAIRLKIASIILESRAIPKATRLATIYQRIIRLIGQEETVLLYRRCKSSIRAAANY